MVYKTTQALSSLYCFLLRYFVVATGLQPAWKLGRDSNQGLPTSKDQVFLTVKTKMSPSHLEGGVRSRDVELRSEKHCGHISAGPKVAQSVL